MEYEVCFSMCHCETVKVELEPDEVEGLSTAEIKELIEQKAWEAIRIECTEYDAEDIIEVNEIIE